MNPSNATPSAPTLGTASAPTGHKGAVSHGPNCPVCGSACDFPPTFRYTAERAAAHFCPPDRDAERHARLTSCIRRLWGRRETEVYYCRECGFGFGWPFVGGDGEFYRIIHESAGYAPWRWEYGETIELASRLLGQNATVLDIGAGDGSFLKRTPPGWKRFASESTEVTRAMLRDAGINVIEDIDRAAAESPASFDLVTLFQVIEHIADHRPVLTTARRLLKPGGLIVLSTPHATELLEQMKATRCPDMPPNHITKWTEKSLGIALNQTGFELVESRREPASWKQLPNSLYLRVKADSIESPGSPASIANRVRNRRVRGHLLRAAGLWSGLLMLPRLGRAKLAANFLVVGRAV